jgi:hypothetical protein
LFTIDRLNKLVVFYGGAPLEPSALQLKSRRRDDNVCTYQSLRPAHDILDALDKQAGIKTEKTLDGERRTVGARVALHCLWADREIAVRLRRRYT